MEEGAATHARTPHRPLPLARRPQPPLVRRLERTHRTGLLPHPARSLAHIGAYHDNRLVGFVNVAWDGGIHAFLLHTCVHPDMRRQGIATQLVREAMRITRARGAEWLHVDFEPHLTSFYRACGFRPTWAS
ncbi:UNVERIFIED_ORG: GNAT superfamily N-acetyltransferase [Rhizobium aethiopicum]